MIITIVLLILTRKSDTTVYRFLIPASQMINDVHPLILMIYNNQTELLVKQSLFHLRCKSSEVDTGATARVSVDENDSCPMCDLQCDSEENAVECDCCKKWFHYNCENLSAVEIDRLENDHSSQYTCSGAKHNRIYF